MQLSDASTQVELEQGLAETISRRRSMNDTCDRLVHAYDQLLALRQRVRERFGCDVAPTSRGESILYQ